MAQPSNFVISSQDDCFYCLQPSTATTLKNNGSWITIRCLACHAMTFALLATYEKNLHNERKKMLISEFGPKYAEIITAARTDYSGKLVCPICDEEIQSIETARPKRRRKKKGSWKYWECAHCISRGYVKTDTIDNWKLISMLSKAAKRKEASHGEAT